MSVIIIGCGGVGSFLAPSISLLVGAHYVRLVDGDTLEVKNLNRQLFGQESIGKNKASELAKKYGCEATPDFYSYGQTAHDPDDVLICVVDNHPARNDVLRACDAYGCCAIIAANETHSAEAYYYRSDWKGTPLDPRVYYPDIETKHDGDPRAAAIGCTGVAQRENPQLVSANFMAAALAQHLFVLWVTEMPKFDPSITGKLPYKLVANLTRLETFRVEDARGH